MKTDLPSPSGRAERHLELIERAIEATGITSPSKLVLRMVEDAARTIEDGPDRERGWLASGRSTTWRMPVGMSYAEAREMEKIRILAGQPIGDSTRPMRTDRGTEDAALVLEWLRWTLDDKRGADLFKSAGIVAQGDKKGLALKVWRPGRTNDRRQTYLLKQKIADRILAGLKGQGIDLRAMLAPAAIAA